MESCLCKIWIRIHYFWLMGLYDHLSSQTLRFSISCRKVSLAASYQIWKLSVCFSNKSYVDLDHWLLYIILFSHTVSTSYYYNSIIYFISVPHVAYAPCGLKRNNISTLYVHYVLWYWQLGRLWLWLTSS